MNLYNIINNIKTLAQNTININSMFVGDVYELNSVDVEYPCAVISQGTHSSSNLDTETYNFHIFLVDRLLEDKTNEIEIKSWANENLKNLMELIEDTDIGDIQDYSIDVFTERFTSLCAGAYLSVNISVDNDNCCGDSAKIVTSVNGQTGDVTLFVPNKTIIMDVEFEDGTTQSFKLFSE